MHYCSLEGDPNSNFSPQRARKTVELSADHSRSQQLAVVRNAPIETLPIRFVFQRSFFFASPLSQSCHSLQSFEESILKPRHLPGLKQGEATTGSSLSTSQFAQLEDNRRSRRCLNSSLPAWLQFHRSSYLRGCYMYVLRAWCGYRRWKSTEILCIDSSSIAV